MIDRIDAKLLNLLQREGPKPVAELGERVGLSASACHRRIRAMEAAGIITGYAARIAPDTIGLGLDVFVDISLTSQSEEALTAFESAVKSFDEILECQLLSGASDYRLRVAARRLRVPTLLVRGRLSDLLSEEGAQEFLALVPHARFADVSDAGHMVAGDRNDRFTTAVLDFLRDLRAS